VTELYIHGAISPVATSKPGDAAAISLIPAHNQLFASSILNNITNRCALSENARLQQGIFMKLLCSTGSDQISME
jgi:hypothetical protein